MKYTKFYPYQIVLVIVLAFLISNASLIAGKWSFVTGVQFVRGKYIYDSSTSTLYFTGGLTYRTERWNVSLSLPIVAQNSSAITNFGGMFIPNQENETHGNSPHSGMHNNEYNGYVSTNQMRFGLGDAYFYGEIQISPEKFLWPSISFTGQMKLPTAAGLENYGTGKFDFGLGISMRKFIYPYSLFLDGSYLRIGDPAGITYRNPLILAQLSLPLCELGMD